jgi:hypothetical protein
MDFSKVNRKDLITDLVKVATFNVVAHILMNMRYGEPLFNERFIYYTTFILIGFATYHIFIAPRLVPTL